MITITIDGQPGAKGRARITRSGIAYTPAKTRAFESHGRMAAQIVMDGREPLAGAVTATISAVLPVPKSWAKRKIADALAGRLRPTSKPDADNYAKAALDACNGIRPYFHVGAEHKHHRRQGKDHIAANRSEQEAKHHVPPCAVSGNTRLLHRAR